MDKKITKKPKESWLKRNEHIAKWLTLFVILAWTGVILLIMTQVPQGQTVTVGPLEFDAHTPDGAKFVFTENHAIMVMRFYLHKEFETTNETGTFPKIIDGYICQECGTQDDCVDVTFSALYKNKPEYEGLLGPADVQNISWFMITYDDITRANGDYKGVLDFMCSE